MYFSKGKQEEVKLTKYQVIVIIAFIACLYFYLD